MPDKMLVNVSLVELVDALMPVIEKIVSQAINENSKQAVFNDQKVVTINQLVKLKTVGGRDRILKLLEQGFIERMPDGKISYPSVINYVNKGNHEKEQSENRQTRVRF